VVSWAKINVSKSNYFERLLRFRMDLPSLLASGETTEPIV
jgi:hypothetical protein